MKEFINNFKMSEKTKRFFLKYEKSLFKYISTDSDIVIMHLKKLKITEIKLFDEGGDSLIRVRGTNSDLVLHLFSTDNHFINTTPLKDQSVIQKHNSTHTSDTGWYYQYGFKQYKSIMYNSRQNYIVSTENPFKNYETLDNLCFFCEQLDVTFISETDSLIDKLSILIGKRRKSLYDKTKNDLSSSRDNLKTHQSRYQSCLQDITHYSKLLKNLESSAKEEESTLKSEIKKTQENPFLKSFDYDTNNNALVFDFGEICISHQVQDGNHEVNGMRVPKMVKKNMYIGNIQIHMTEDRFKCFNTDNSVRHGANNPHPHGDSDNYICFGEIGDEMTKLRQEFSLFEISQKLFSWVTSYNDDDAYLSISNWRTKEEYENSKKGD